MPKTKKQKIKRINKKEISKKTEIKIKKQIPIGGMAFSNGLMLRSYNNAVIVIRDDIGKVEVFSFSIKKIREKFGVLFIPFLRGIFFILENIYFVFKTSGYKKIIGKKILGRKTKGERIYLKMDRFFTYIIYALITFGFFDYLYLRLNSKPSGDFSQLTFDFIISLLYIFIFVILFVLLYFGARQKSELFTYHAVEHKVIGAYEKYGKSDIGNIDKFNNYHNRCSIYVYFWAVVFLAFLISFFKISQASWGVGFLASVGLFFLSFSVSYEFVKIISRSVLLSAIFLDPLKFLQYLTFHKPDDNHLKVGEIAINELLNLEKNKK